MRQLIFQLCLLVVALAATASALPTDFQPSPQLDEHWKQFKSTYAKAYDAKFEIVRRQIWEENLRVIQRHNLEYDMGKHSYFLGVNQYADMTNAEYRARVLGSRARSARAPSNRSTRFLPPLNMPHLPSVVDWRTKGYVTPVKDQGRCGSCWAFSTTGSLEGQFFRKTGTLKSFSEQQLVDCSRHYGNYGCAGGLMDQAFEYIEKFGIEQETAYPYTATNGRCSYDRSQVVTKVRNYVDVKSGSERELEQAAATVGPISVAIDASHYSFQHYKGGIYSEPLCSSTRLDHGVLVVGYGTDSSTQEDYWLVKNSWGTSWGDHGYIKMTRNRQNQCGIATQASFPIV